MTAVGGDIVRQYSPETTRLNVGLSPPVAEGLLRAMAATRIAKARRRHAALWLTSSVTAAESVARDRPG